MQPSLTSNSVSTNALLYTENSLSTKAITILQDKDWGILASGILTEKNTKLRRFAIVKYDFKL
jgi:hypothetical protein